MNPVNVDARFIGVGQQQLFLVMHSPPQPDPQRRCVLIVPPFAEEMNKSRRMMAQAGRGLAARGIHAVLPDFYGTGDSAGEFHEATWARWRRDLQATVDFISAEGLIFHGLLGIRSGCALACEAALEGGWNIRQSVFWQPVLDGARFLTQFLRLRVVATMMEPGARETTADLRARLEAGESLEIAGYELSPAMAGQLERFNLVQSLGPGLGRIQWYEVVRDAQSPLSAAVERAAGEVHARGIALDVSAVSGEAFWSATEIVENAQLVDKTIETLAAS